MKIPKIKKNLFFITIVILFCLQFLMVQNCLSHSHEEKEVEARAQKYWDSKLTGDVITCYQLETLHYRKRVPLSVYAKNGSLVFKEVRIKKIVTDDDKATVIVKIKYFLPAFGSRHVFSTTVKDRWVKIAGKWYHMMKDDVSGRKIQTTQERR